MSFARPSWCLTIWMLICLFLVPTANAVNLPQAAVAAQQTSTPAASTTAEGEQTLEDKKAAYAALANILENNDSRQELIDQLRQAATSKANNEQPVLAPPQADQEDPTVLESVTNVTREYGGAVASQFVRLHDNIVNAPHKSFNQQTFFNALKYFAGLAAAVFAFYWFTRLLMYPVWQRMGRWGRNHNLDRTKWLHLPATIIVAFLLDLVLLALTLFVGQIISDN